MTTDNKIVRFPDAERIEERAAEWAVRASEGSLSEEEQASFDAWHAESARHREAYARLSQVWDQCDALTELRDHAAADITRASLREAGTGSEGGATRFLPGLRTLLAASVAAAAFLVASTLERTDAEPPQPTVAAAAYEYETVAETAVGERRTVTLPDGSSVELNTASQVSVHYAADSRVVYLTRGEVHFIVASDPQRPFSVHAADRVVTAVGTAFSVQLRPDAVEVTVAEGKVRLAGLRAAQVAMASNEPQMAVPALEAGQSAVLREGSQRVAALAPAELERKLAWRQGLLAFAGEPLLQVLQEIGRYTDIVIEVTDPQLRDLPVAGQLRIDDVESMLQALQLMADVRVERLNERHVRLRARAGA